MFDPEEFLKRPPQEILDTLRALSLTRDELVVLARHLEIEPKTSKVHKVHKTRDPPTDTSSIDN